MLEAGEPTGWNLPRMTLCVSVPAPIWTDSEKRDGGRVVDEAGAVAAAVDGRSRRDCSWSSSRAC